MRSPRRSANEQYELIMECRSSGLSDQQWCLQHDINPGTFYNWVKRLKAKKCYDIPPATGRDGLTASVKQDVVKVEILPDPSGQIHETAVSAHSTDTEQIRPQPLTAQASGTDPQKSWRMCMLGDISVVSELYIVCGYTDYPRSIVIREELLLSTINTDIFVNLLK